MSPYVHFDVRSYFSLKEGAFSPEPLARRAAELGMPAVALADRDGLYGAARFVAAGEREGVRPILGASLTLREAGTLPLPRSGRKPKYASVLLLAREEGGYANLCRLVTDAHTTGERGDPSLTPEQVCAHAGGLGAVLGAAGPVATTPVRYLVPEDAFLADALECMRELVPISRTNVSRRNAEGWLKPAAEMRALFAERPDLLTASAEIAESCDLDLDLRRVRFPDFPTPPGRSASSILAERCWRGLDRRGMKPTARVKDRLNHELAMIHRLGHL